MMRKSQGRVPELEYFSNRCLPRIQNSSNQGWFHGEGHVVCWPPAKNIFRVAACNYVNNSNRHRIERSLCLFNSLDWCHTPHAQLAPFNG